MRSERALRTCIQGIVFLNLVFVQLTGVAGLHWLAPLYVLTACAPLLARFRENLAYRLLWNGAVICVFSVLLGHALSGYLSYVLEDGLVLAVLCQVHLLNNLRARQRPDLLFFNAFLIAIITGFMTRELGFAAAFLVFAPFFIIGQQLLSATRQGRQLSSRATRLLVFDGAKRSGLLLGLSLLAFLFWPRDFDRKPLFRGTFEMVSGGQQLELGFNEKLELNRTGKVESSNRAALRVEIIKGTSADVPSLWRGATLGTTTGSSWHPVQPKKRRSAHRTDERWIGQRDRLERSNADDPQAPQVEVVRYGQDTERLFSPLGARALQLGPAHRGGLLRARHDGTIDVAETDDVTYTLTLSKPDDVALSGVTRERLPSELQPFVDLPITDRIDLARELATSLAQRAEPEVDEQHELVEMIREHLARTYVYLAPGSEGAASSLEEFLRGESGGHCEFFASALATMLRSLNIPARVVTGYRSSNWDGAGTVLSFGQSDAHAWVEVHDPSGGWYAVDASPIQVETVAGTSAWERLKGVARSVWGAVTEFDDERRAAVFAWAREQPARVVRATRRHPIAALLLVLGAVLPVGLWIRRLRARTDPAVRAYRRVLKRAKIRRDEGETPRELLARAAGQGLADDDLHALEAATQRHEAARYAA